MSGGRLRAIVADAHLGERAGDVDRFGRFLDELRALGAGELNLLGDTFAYFIADERYLTGTVREALALLDRFRAGGARVHLIEGNRDFFVRGSEVAAEHFDSAGLARAVQTASRRYLLVHGDLIDPYDRGYRLWRFLSKNPLAFLAMKALPPALGRPIVEHFESRLHGYTPSHGRIDELSLLSYARARFAEGFDRVVVGHHHRFLRTIDGGRDLIALPAWRDGGGYALLAASGALAVCQRTRAA